MAIQIHCSLRLYIEAAVLPFGYPNGLLAKMIQREKAGAKTLPPVLKGSQYSQYGQAESAIFSQTEYIVIDDFRRTGTDVICPSYPFHQVIDF